MIGKRLTAERRLVSQFDEAFVKGFTDEQREEYSSSLDIDVLKGLDKLRDKPTVFKVEPLKSKYEYLTYSDSPDAWSIFATHVKALEYCNEIKLTFSNDIIDDNLRDEIPPRIVQNIASMIIALANTSGKDAFFLQSVASLRFSQAVMRQHAQKRMVVNAPSKAVKRKRSK